MSNSQGLFQATVDAQSKTAYFLLAAAGAAIGFAVQKTEGLMLSRWLLPVGLAIVCWAASFYCGCMNRMCIQGALSMNFRFLNSPFTAKDPTGQEMLRLIDVENSKAGRYAASQFRLLILGAVCFIAWRVLEMARATYPQLG